MTLQVGRRTATGATYDPSTGNLTITTGAHSLTTADSIKIVANSLTFSCTYGAGVHNYVGGNVTNAVNVSGTNEDVNFASYC